MKTGILWDTPSQVKGNSHVYTGVQTHKHECLLTGMDSKKNRLRGKDGRVQKLDEERCWSQLQLASLLWARSVRSVRHSGSPDCLHLLALSWLPKMQDAIRMSKIGDYHVHFNNRCSR